MADPITIGALALTAVGTGISAMGTLAGGNAASSAAQAEGEAARMSGQASYEAGVRNQKAMEFRAKGEEQAAQESRAAAQRVALDKRRETGLVLSKLQARAAASGGGADDPTVINLAESITGRGEYESLLEMYKGENRARGLEDQAASSRMTGESLLYEGIAKQKEGNMRYGAKYAEASARKSASELSALGTIVGGAGSMYRQYNKIDRYG